MTERRGDIQGGEGVERSGATDQPATAVGRVFTVLSTYQYADAGFALEIGDEHRNTYVLQLHNHDGTGWQLEDTSDPEARFIPFGDTSS